MSVTKLLTRRQETRLISDVQLLSAVSNGVFVVYKPLGLSFACLKQDIRKHVCKGLNDIRKPDESKLVNIVGSTIEQMQVVEQPDYTHHPLINGPYYKKTSMDVTVANRLDGDTSGVMLCGLNQSSRLIDKIANACPMKFYKVTGMLGHATNNYFRSGKIVERSSFQYVKRTDMDRIVNSMQSSHQRKMFDLCGVDMQSQAAYELACKGPIRPVNTKIPMIYSIKCTDFLSPKFVLEIVCTNEYEMYLKTLIHELGLQLHTTATCFQIQCYKFGVFDTSMALLRRQWTLESILNNVRQCKQILKAHPQLLKQESPTLKEQSS